MVNDQVRQRENAENPALQRRLGAVERMFIETVVRKRLEKAGLFTSTRQVHNRRQEFLGTDAIAFSVECTF